MQSGFDLFGIDHLSASSINLWINDPAVWVAQKLLGHKFPGSPAMWRGICVEDAVTAVIGHGQDIDKAKRDALIKFDTRAPATDKTAKERDSIAPMVDLALEQLGPLGRPDVKDAGQHKVEILCRGDGWSIPFIGYLDYLYDADIVDLKTTQRMPSVMSDEHQVQRAVYASSTNKRVRFLYVTPKKAECREDGDPASILARVKEHASRLERFLRLVRTPECAREVVPVADGSFYWTGAEDIRRSVFNL